MYFLDGIYLQQFQILCPRILINKIYTRNEIVLTQAGICKRTALTALTALTTLTALTALTALNALTALTTRD
jgi:hypothetical protein